MVEVVHDYGTWSLPGDVYLTRNVPELNQTPGYWQHVAISNGWAVIEAQAPGVIMVREEAFRRRNPERLLLRPRLPEQVCSDVATAAETYIGWAYHARRLNCVTLARLAFAMASDRSFTWRSPSALARDRLLREVEHYENYEDWTQPSDWYEGRLM